MSSEMHICQCGDAACAAQMIVQLRCDSCAQLMHKGTQTKIILVSGEHGHTVTHDLCEICCISPIVLGSIGRHPVFHLQHGNAVQELMELTEDAQQEVWAAAHPKEVEMSRQVIAMRDARDAAAAEPEA